MLARWITATVPAVLLLTSCTPPLAEVATPGPGWPDLASPLLGTRDGRADAALIIAIEDPAHGGRAGAHQVASGWWRYLVETRGLRRARVSLLGVDGHEASAEAIADAVARLENRAGSGSILWLVFIGSAISPSDGADGSLLAADGARVPFAEIRDALSAGFHESAFMVVDGCAGPGVSLGVDERAGLPASPKLEGPVQFEARRRALRRAMQAPELEHYRTDEGGAPPTSGLSALVKETLGRVEAEQRKRAGTPRNTFVVSAGVGEGCGATLAGRPWPALAYSVLGGLQGWADLDDDRLVSAVELATFAQSILTEPTGPRLSAAGVDLILAEVGPGRLPRPATPPGATPPGATPPGDEGPDPMHVNQRALDEAAAVLELETEDMASVRAGGFVRGCEPRHADICEADETPARWIELDGFAIDRREVSWGDYRACVEAGLCGPVHLGDCWTWTGKGFVEGAELPAELFADDHPVMCVSWREASTYCEAVGKRLPTEAEWERAARGTDGRSYPWGETAPSCELAVMDGCSTFSRPVGSRAAGASPVGALDMSGNVSEWVADWWSDRSYRWSKRHNPTGASTGEVRGVRGGSFYDSDFNLRASYRYGVEPTARLSVLGFRCAR